MPKGCINGQNWPIILVIHIVSIYDDVSSNKGREVKTLIRLSQDIIPERDLRCKNYPYNHFKKYKDCDEEFVMKEVKLRRNVTPVSELLQEKLRSSVFLLESTILSKTSTNLGKFQYTLGPKVYNSDSPKFGYL